MDVIARAPSAAGGPRAGVVIAAGDDRQVEIQRALRDQGLRVPVVNGIDALERSPSDSDAPLLVLVADGPDTSPLRALAHVQRISDARVVLVCGSLEGWEVRAAIAAGAAGIVLANEIETTLVPCVQAVLTEQVCVPYRHRLHFERPVLSAREKQALGLVVLGYTNGEIAQRLFLAESTVKSHLSSAFTKLGVRSRHEAVDLILDPGGGLGMGILALDSEPVSSSTPSANARQ